MQDEVDDEMAQADKMRWGIHGAWATPNFYINANAITKIKNRVAIKEGRIKAKEGKLKGIDGSKVDALCRMYTFSLVKRAIGREWSLFHAKNLPELCAELEKERIDLRALIPRRKKQDLMRAVPSTFHGGVEEMLTKMQNQQKIIFPPTPQLEGPKLEERHEHVRLDKNNEERLQRAIRKKVRKEEEEAAMLAAEMEFEFDSDSDYDSD
jgi:hypothetical protein